MGLEVSVRSGGGVMQPQKPAEELDKRQRPPPQSLRREHTLDSGLVASRLGDRYLYRFKRPCVIIR